MKRSYCMDTNYTPVPGFDGRYRICTGEIFYHGNNITSTLAIFLSDYHGTGPVYEGADAREVILKVLAWIDTKPDLKGENLFAAIRALNLPGLVRVNNKE
jgi:hypothetical protein